MPWMLIFEMVIEMIMKCQETRRRADIEAGLLDPGVQEIGALRFILRKQGLRGRKLRDAVNEGLAWAKSQPEAIYDLMAEAEERVQSAASDDPA